MKCIAVAVALASAAIASTAAAQDVAAPTPDVVVKAYSDYAHPEITAADCRTVNASEVECVIPAGSAGQYLVEVSGTSTALDAKAMQGMKVGGDRWICAQATNVGSTPAKPWASGPRTLKLSCQISVLTDAPLHVAAIYGDMHAKKDPKGPVMTIKRLAWNGVVSSQAVSASAQ